MTELPADSREKHTHLVFAQPSPQSPGEILLQVTLE